jgi:hypothetical protein
MAKFRGQKTDSPMESGKSEEGRKRERVNLMMGVVISQRGIDWRRRKERKSRRWFTFCTRFRDWLASI